MQTHFSDKAPGNSGSQEPDFLKTDGGKTKSNAIDVPSITLPKGGGAINGIDEKFAVNALNGTGSFSIPLPFSAARGVNPSLSVTYNSGSGNDTFGLGWKLNSHSIRRKTEKGLPQYIDAIESDIFLFSEAEDLVPEFKKEEDESFSVDENGDYIINEKDSPDTLYTIRGYRPRIEGLFARIERWMEKSTGIIKWRVITRDNVTTLFGWTANAVVADPTDARKIYEWLPEFVFDDKGNCTRYLYKKEDAAGFNASLLYNRNRFNGDITYTNRYPERVLYGNKTPYTNFGDAFPAETDFMFQTVFDYGEYDTNAPYTKITDWDFRPDAFSDYKPGFELRTTRLCKRVLLFHFFPELPGGSALVKSVNFDYDTVSEKDFTFLRSVTWYGYLKQDNGTYTSKNLPPLEFEYQQHDWNSEVRTISPDNLTHAPAGLSSPQYQLVDLFNEGLPGILTEQANGWYYKYNLGDGRFEQATQVSPKPSFIGLGSQLLLTDLDADGGKQLVSYMRGHNGYFDLINENDQPLFRSFQAVPNIDFADPQARMIDLDFDGRPEVMITEDNVITWYRSEGRKGFSQARKTIKPFDEEAGPFVVFADEKQTIFLADMCGDGLTDIVRIRNGEVCYWPNLGYGLFGTKVAMENAPVFDHPDAFNPSFIRLADIDGSGTTDLIYLGKNKFSCWLNLSGNRFAPTPFEIDSFPAIDTASQVTVTDLLGNGVSCIVWSGSLTKDTGSGIRYVDLMNSRKPHILSFYKNNMGKEVSIEYTPSTKFYIEDKMAGKPWVTKLHFPVHCVSKTTIVDKITGWQFVTAYKYHHGYYDHQEREFRGFGMVEQTDSETFDHWIKGGAGNVVEQELHQDPVLHKNWYHTGAFIQEGKILDQFAHEYWYEEMNRQGFPVVHNETALPGAYIIPAPGIPLATVNHLSADEWREAWRACKSMGLRSEVFALDAPAIGATPSQIKKQLTPFTVATHNCVIELIQPKGQNRNAVFIVKESERINYNYERNIDDPRISHTLNIKIDKYGNGLQSASIVYGRLLTDASLPAETQQQQAKTLITYSQYAYTNDVTGNDTHRLRVPSEDKTFELKGVPKTGSIYTVADFEEILNDANSDTAEYQELDKALAGKPQKRLIEHIRRNYYRNDCTGPLALHQLESRAIAYENYQLAYTPALLNDIYGAKVNNALMTEGRFTHSEGDSNWWVRSGTVQLIAGAETVADARARFFSPLSYTDPYGSINKVKYYSNYFLFIEEKEDALKNKTKVDQFNFFTCTPRRIIDINNNISEVLTDELGLVKAMAVFGKGNEADDITGITPHTTLAEQNAIDAFLAASLSTDLVTRGKNLLQHATARFVYDLDVYKNSGLPITVATILREEHFQKNNDAPIQLSFEYLNGLVKVVMKKMQVEPGVAKKVTVNPDNTYVITDVDTAALIPQQLRWIGNGRTIVNNKGNAVKQYESYFSVTHRYENIKELVETGFTPLMYYDAPGRLIKTQLPDETFTRREFDNWKESSYDANDTILQSNWYTNRTNRLIDAQLIADGKDPGKEKMAADKAAKHANTPGLLHLDALGRPVLLVDHNKNLATDADEFYRTKVGLDIESNLRSVTDARENVANTNKGNLVMQYKFDMLGNKVYQQGTDSGKRWLLTNVVGNALRTWDERSHEFQYYYDELHRPLQTKILGGDGPAPLDNIYDRIIYGESLLLPNRSNEAAIQANNVLGNVIKHYDTGGVVLTPQYNFKGQAVATTRKLFKNYKSVANWTDANLVTDLENEAFTFNIETDALGRVATQTAPDGSTITPAYNRSGFMKALNVAHVNPVLNAAYIKDIDYNEKGQRSRIVYGNDVTTTFFYNKETLRLNRLQTKRQNNDPLQDWYYTFDPVGNITHIEDKNIPLVFFNNQKVTGISEYTYDALYRLRAATGRENDIALPASNKDNWNDQAFMTELNPGDPVSVKNYTQLYQYDEAGNIVNMQHVSAGNNWTRLYNYEDTGNRLKNTQVGVDTYAYTWHLQHGFMTSMPHIEEMGWSFKEELVKSSRQKVNPGNGTAETTYYQYDGSGQRIRKITENAAAAGIDPTKKDERIYIAGFETYRTYQANAINFERETLSLLDEGHRFVMIETVKQNTAAAPLPSEAIGARLVRYQLHNHLGSAALELDENAQVISYEEYHPFGTTAYQAKSAAIKAAAKRYRFTGMERDEETGFEYHSARYYLPWLGRWLSTDPAGIKGGVNVYAYVRSNTITRVDTNGRWDVDWGEVAIGFGVAAVGVALVVVTAGVAGPAVVAGAATILGVSEATVVTGVAVVGTAAGIVGTAETTNQVINGTDSSGHALSDAERSRALGRLPVEAIATVLGARGISGGPPSSMSVRIPSMPEFAPEFATTGPSLPPPPPPPPVTITVPIPTVVATPTSAVSGASATGAILMSAIVPGPGGGNGGNSGDSSSSGSSSAEERPPVDADEGGVCEAPEEGSGDLASVDPQGEPFTDPNPRTYSDGSHPSRPVVDHRLARSMGGHPTDPANLNPEAWETNARKGGLEGNYLRELREYMRQGLTRAEAEYVLQGERDYILNDVHARPTDANLMQEDLPTQSLMSSVDDPVCQ